jgi:hypothetical protein
MNGRKSVMEMVGEFLREAAVLVLVFVPLDVAVREKFSGAGLAGALVISAGLLIGGIILQRKRSE